MKRSALNIRRYAATAKVLKSISRLYSRKGFFKSNLNALALHVALGRESALAMRAFKLSSHSLFLGEIPSIESCLYLSGLRSAAHAFPHSIDQCFSTPKSRSKSVSPTTVVV